MAYLHCTEPEQLTSGLYKIVWKLLNYTWTRTGTETHSRFPIVLVQVLVIVSIPVLIIVNTPLEYKRPFHTKRPWLWLWLRRGTLI